MRFTILAGVAAICLTASPALAWYSESTATGGTNTANGGNANATGGAATSTSKSNAASSSGSAATANGGHVVNNNSINVPAGAGAAGAGGGAGAGIGGFPAFPAASAIAPSIYQNNNCSGSALSAGVQSGVFGLSFGTGNYFDDACRLHMIGLDGVAFEYLCHENKAVRKAALAAGHPCAADQPKVQPVGNRVVIEQHSLPEWCEHLSSPAEKQEYAAVCRLPGAVRLPDMGPMPALQTTTMQSTAIQSSLPVQPR
jgi:hypothetical protein